MCGGRCGRVVPGPRSGTEIHEDLHVIKCCHPGGRVAGSSRPCRTRRKLRIAKRRAGASGAGAKVACWGRGRAHELLLGGMVTESGEVADGVRERA